MIVSFKDRGTEAVFNGSPAREIRKYPREILSRVVRKLDMLNGAQSLGDLKAPPSNRLELLKGHLAGYVSIRVNDQWRLVFKWAGSEAHDVWLTDYH